MVAVPLSCRVQIFDCDVATLACLSPAPYKGPHCCVQAHPGLTAASFPWPSGPAYKMRALQFPYTAGALIYARDKDSGEVYLGADGLPRIKYWPSAGDRASMMKVGQHPIYGEANTLVLPWGHQQTVPCS